MQFGAEFEIRSWQSHLKSIDWSGCIQSSEKLQQSTRFLMATTLSLNVAEKGLISSI